MGLGGDYKMQDDFNEFKIEVITRLTKIEEKLDDYKNIKDKTEEAYNLSKKNEEDIKAIQDNARWLWRTIAGILIAGIISAIIVFK